MSAESRQTCESLCHAHRDPCLSRRPAAGRRRPGRCLRRGGTPARRPEGLPSAGDRHRGWRAVQRQRPAAAGRRDDREPPRTPRHPAGGRRAGRGGHRRARRPAALAAAPGEGGAAHRLGVQRRLRARGRRAAAGPACRDALERGRPARRREPRHAGRARCDLREGRPALHLGRRDGRHGPGARDGRRRPWPRPGAARRARARDVPEAARRAKPVQRTWPRRRPGSPPSARCRTMCWRTCAATCRCPRSRCGPA